MKFGRLHKTLVLIMLAVLALCSLGAQSAYAAPNEDGGKPFCISFTSPAGVFRYEDGRIEPTDVLVADEIFTRKINAPLKEKRALMARAVRAGATYERAVTYCMPLAKKVIDCAAQKLYIAPVDAQIRFNPGSRPPFTIKRDKAGREVDRERAFELIYIAVQTGRSGDTLKLPLAEIKPDIDAKELIERTYMRSDFATEYSQSVEDRSHNIALALFKINGTVLGAGEEFSFNKTVGPRTEKNGFKQAKIIKGGEYVLGYGGGVCQASTTLYNAALRADMKIIAASPHSLTPGYVPPSLDAMVNGSATDLKFVNPLDTEIYIEAYAHNGIARVRIYGLKNEYAIIPVSRVIKTTPPPDDEIIRDSENKYFPIDADPADSMRIRSGKDGVKSEAYLEYYKEGKLYRRVLIREDTYYPLRGAIVIPSDGI